MCHELLAKLIMLTVHMHAAVQVGTHLRAWLRAAASEAPGQRRAQLRLPWPPPLVPELQPTCRNIANHHPLAAVSSSLSCLVWDIQGEMGG
jgi:hypothetical protein